jgi:hypothetical protein
MFRVDFFDFGVFFKGVGVRWEGLMGGTVQDFRLFSSLFFFFFLLFLLG